MSVFWAVWRKDGGSPPNTRHRTKQDAITEARRLAIQSLKDYYILQVIGCVELPSNVEVSYNEDLEGN